ncbi:hypothetical protein [Candidatus Villigracilis saccharophilus]|uniref:hypothetical protein n=1 Tax=Candidatus Villigracilis saccharophilus TaxID=3140684 RepID=UPI0031E69F5E
MMSGNHAKVFERETTCPSAQKPDCTSSKINNIPCLSQISRSPFMKDIGGTIYPPSPITKFDQDRGGIFRRGLWEPADIQVFLKHTVTCSSLMPMLERVRKRRCINARGQRTKTRAISSLGSGQCHRLRGAPVEGTIEHNMFLPARRAALAILTAFSSASALPELAK